MKTASIQPGTEAFCHMMDKASDEERTVLGEMHLHYEAEIHRLVDDGNEPQNIAHSINGLVDKSVADTLKTKNGRMVKCARGCGACCKINVSITHEEAVLILIATHQAGVPIDWAKVERQSRHTLATWKDQDAADRRCVFLNDREECGVYKHRPAACRKYMVASDPSHCNTVKHPGADVMIVAPIVGEAIVSAMLGVLDWDSMPQMLLKARAESMA